MKRWWENSEIVRQEEKNRNKNNKKMERWGKIAR